MNLKTRSIALLAVVAVALCLAGCQLTQRPTGQPLVIRKDGTGIEVAVCDALQISGVLMQEREYPGAWRTIWEFDMSMTLNPGDGFSSSQAEQLGLAQASRPNLAANHEIALFLHSDNASGTGGAFATFLIGSDGLSDTAWLHDDGSLTQQPCD